MSYQPVQGQNYGRDDGYGQGGYGNNETGYNNNPYQHDYNNVANNQYPMAAKGNYVAHDDDYNPAAKKKSNKKWWWIIGALLLIAIIVGAVVGGVVGTRDNNKNNSESSSDGSGSNADGEPTKTHSGVSQSVGTATATGTGTATASGASGLPTALPVLLSYLSQENSYDVGSDGAVYLPLGTDVSMLPAYATGTQTATPYAAPTTGANGGWPADDSTPSASSRRAHPRIHAPSYKWNALKNGMIAADPYLSAWNATIIGNAEATLGSGYVAYVLDGGRTGSGVLDVAREIKLRVKNWAYAYHITGDTQYAERVWNELNNAANGNGDFGQDAPDGDIWNCNGHFLDCAEFTNAFGLMYDWLYDYWTTDRRNTLRGWIVTHGLTYGQLAYTGSGWWTGVSPGNADKIIDGNWNCVNNAGLLVGSLAIIDEDTTGIAKDLIDKYVVQGALNNCFQGAYSDGTWAETPNYWYFGTTGAAEIASALLTAQGSAPDIDGANSGFKETGSYHMYITGMTGMMNYGDHGPNKFSTTANGMFMWANLFNKPEYALYQRDHIDASEPYSMFWYDPSTRGAWWNGLALDKHFGDAKGDWGSARSSWSDNSGTYWAMKASLLQNHQTHGDLDIGTFVFDAMGQRWAGELGSDQYLGDYYFSNETQDSARWTYYRKRTEGQNTIMINRANQLVGATPSTKFESSGTAQGGMPSVAVQNDDTAYMTVDMSSAYGSGITAKRGIRFLNGRTQLLVQDEVSGASGADIQWRMHTNATKIDLANDDTQATLTLNGKTLVMNILNANGLKFATTSATPQDGDATPVQGPNPQYDINMDNSGVTVLYIDSPNSSSFSSQVLFTPQWPDKSDYVTNPSSVAIDNWSLASHN